MKKLIFIVILIISLCGIFSGCGHTLDKLSRFNAGNIDARDLAEAMVNDELAFRKAYW